MVFEISAKMERKGGPDRPIITVIVEFGKKSVHEGSNIKIWNIRERWAANIDLAISIRFGGLFFF
jgi:hypothetical protein